MGEKVVSVFTNWFCWTQRPHHLVNYIGSVQARADVFSMKTALSRGPALRDPHRLKASCLCPRPLTALSGVRRWNTIRKDRLLDSFFTSRADCQIFAAAPQTPTSTVRDCQRIYDCMDDWSSFPGPTVEIGRHERRLCEWADRIWVVSHKLKDLLAPKFKDRVEYVPNGVDYEHFQSVPDLRADLRSERPTLGYMGAIESWFDVKLVRDVARILKDWSIVLVGPNRLSPEDRAHLNLANIQHGGRIAYSRLPALMATFDVAMIPFKINDLIKATSPIKLYEYLAAGLPVVATPMPEVVPMSENGVLSCCETAEGFAEAVRFLKSNARTARCQEIARNHTWRVRFEHPLARILNPRPEG